MALLVPSLRGVWQRYNMTRCQTNLAHIYQAFRLRAADEAMGEARAYLVAGWTGALLPYLENDASQFKCMETFEGDETEGPAFTEFVYVHTKQDWPPYREFDTELEPGPFMLKVSDTQYREAQSKGVFKEYVEGLDVPRDYPEYTSYVPDNNPHIYWLCMEDGPGPGGSIGGDYKDLMIQVTYDEDDESVTLDCVTGGTNCWNFLIDRQTGDVVIEMKYKGADWTIKTYPLLGVMGEPTSYGMNEYAIDKVAADGKLIRRGVGGAGGKILVLDYARIVASPDNDIWTDEVFGPDENDVPRFARHFGMANVLFSDGSVQPMRPADIDPFELPAEMKWWEP
jgi:prepilin-type processing-associated H-X9-DG protein